MAELSNNSILISKGEQDYDISDLVEKIQWGGRKGSSSRSLTVTLIDDDDRAERANILVEKGQQCLYNMDGEELFRGMIMKTRQTHDKKCVFTAYDLGIYLANNEDTFTYKNKTLADIFKDVCSRFGIPYSECSSVSFRIPDLTKSKTTAWDVLCDAMSIVYKNAGVRHYIDSQKGYLRLTTRRDNIMLWAIEVGTNIISFDATTSIEKVKTRIKVLSKEGTVIAEKRNSSLEKAIGIMQGIEQADENLNKAQIQNLAAETLREKSEPEKKLKIEALGLPDVISGAGVFVVIPSLNIYKAYYVEEDTHTIKDNYHTMALTLSEATDLTEVTDDSPGKYQAGSIVDFSGGYHYRTSQKTTSVGGYRTGGKAMIVNIAPKAKHRYALIGGAYCGCGGNSNVYGWVDEDTVK